MANRLFQLVQLTMDAADLVVEVILRYLLV